ncbi:MAG TPA: SCO family protein [Steroidobacteraceae bacterium]
MKTRRTWWILGVAAICAAVAGFWLARELDSTGPTLASGTWLPQPKTIGDFHLIDHRGRPFSLLELQGKPELVFFGFTHCPDICPGTLYKLAQIKKAAAIPGLRVVFVTVDPARDTPTLVATYVHAFDPDFVGLTGTDQSIVKMAADFGVAVNKVDLPGGDYTMDHSAVVFLMNTRGQVAGIFTPPFDTTRFAEDLDRAAPFLR